MFNFRKSLRDRLCTVTGCNYKDLSSPFAGVSLRTKFVLRNRLARTHPNFILSQSALVRVTDKHEYHVDFIGNDIYTVLVVLCIDLSGFAAVGWRDRPVGVGLIVRDLSLTVRSLSLYV